MKKTLLLLPLMAMSMCALSSCTSTKTFKAMGDEIYSYVDFNLTYQIKNERLTCSVIVKVDPKAKSGYQLNWIECAMWVDVTCFGIKNGETTNYSKQLRFLSFANFAPHEQEDSVVPFFDSITNATASLSIHSTIDAGCEANLTKL